MYKILKKDGSSHIYNLHPTVAGTTLALALDSADLRLFHLTQGS